MCYKTTGKQYPGIERSMFYLVMVPNLYRSLNHRRVGGLQSDDYEYDMLTWLFLGMSVPRRSPQPGLGAGCCIWERGLPLVSHGRDVSTLPSVWNGGPLCVLWPSMKAALPGPRREKERERFFDCVCCVSL